MLSCQLGIFQGDRKGNKPKEKKRLLTKRELPENNVVEKRNL